MYNIIYIILGIYFKDSIGKQVVIEMINEQLV